MFDFDVYGDVVCLRSTEQGDTEVDHQVSAVSQGICHESGGRGSQRPVTCLTVSTLEVFRCRPAPLW